MNQRILLFSDSHYHTMILKRALPRESLDIDSNAESIIDFFRQAANGRQDMIICVKERFNRIFVESIRQLMCLKPMPIVIFVRYGDEESAAAAIEAGVSAYVIDGLREDRVKPILSAAVTRFKETMKLRQELNKTQIDLKERKLVERAKGLLMKQHGCDEDNAYTALRKMAMDRNLRIGQVAENVITVANLMN